MKYYLNDSSFYISLTLRDEIEDTFYSLSGEISVYFPDEIEIKIDDSIIKTNTTNLLLKKFLPKEKLTFLTLLLPPHKDRYKLYLDDILDSMKKKPNQIRFLKLIQKTIEINIEADFSCFIPFLSQYIKEQIVKNYSSKLEDYVLVLCRIVCLLFISPPTRSQLIELFENFMPSFKRLVHPSSLNTIVVSNFIEEIVTHLNNYLNDMTKTQPRFFRNLSQKILPSQGELHKFLTMTSQINILNITNIDEFTQILFETKLDPLLIDRYFEVAFQCINLTDPVSVACSGWFIMSGIICSIEKSDTILNNFESLFILAVNNLHVEKLQSIISLFMTNLFFNVPFNREKTIKSLEFIDFPQLVRLYYEKVIQILIALPVNENGHAELLKSFKDSNILISTILFRNCEKSVFDEVLPIFTSLATCENIIHSVYMIEIILRNYCIYSSKEQCEKIVKAFKIQLELENLTPSRFQYLVIVYSTLLTSNLKSVEAAKKTVDFILPFTKNENDEFRKYAWEALYFIFSLSNKLPYIDVRLKKEIMKDNPFEMAKFEDFEFNQLPSLDFSDLLFEVLDPVFEKLMTLTDKQEINKLLNETGYLCIILDHYYQFSEGSTSKEDVNEIFNGSINFVQENIKKNLLIKDKIMKCAIRLIKDFPDNEDIMLSIILLVSLFGSTLNNCIYLIFLSFIRFVSKKKSNSEFLFYLVNSANKQRKYYLIPPLNELFKQVIESVVDLSMSKSIETQTNCLKFLIKASNYYSPFVDKIIYEKIFQNKDNSTRFQPFLRFISANPSETLFLNNEKLFCETILFVLKNFELNDEKSENSLVKFIHQVVFKSFPIGTNKGNTKEYVDMLHEIEENYLYKHPINRMYNRILMLIIIVSLRRVDEVSEKILDFVIKGLVHCDVDISFFAQFCFLNILRRKEKVTKQKVKIIKRKYDDFPNLFDQVSIELPPDGIFISSSIKTTEKDKNDIKDSESYSIDSEPTSSFDVNYQETHVNEDIIKIFKSFEKIKIEWKYDEYLDYYEDSSNFKNYQQETYCVKKYEFINDELLIKNIKNILVSATNLIDEKDTENGIVYEDIWYQYSLTVGPFCIQKLSKLTRKFLSQYYEVDTKVISTILTDMITGFMKGIRAWNIEDRIQFFKLILLPVVAVFSSTQMSSIMPLIIIITSNISLNPYCFAPVLKIFYEISESGPNLTVFHDTLISLLAKQVSISNKIFINSFDQLKEKYVDAFVDRIGEYKYDEIQSIVSLIFSFLNSSQFSEKVELKTKTIEIFNKILNTKIVNENIKRNLTYFTSISFINFCDSSKSIRLLLVPVYIAHFHTIFALLNDLNVNDKDSVVNFSLFIINDVLFDDNELELKFVSSFVKELKNSSLRLQDDLLEILNTMFERNIFNIPRNDFMKYEECLLEYNRFAIQKNFGKEVRLKIAKIIGIFETRICTFNDELNEDNIIKAAALILNTFLLDIVDEKIVEALNFLELNCTSKESKNKELYEGVLDVFIHKHSNHVINEAQEFIDKCSNYLKPSYIS